MNNTNDNDPDNLGGFDDLLPAEILKKLNELLEQLHKADFPNRGGFVLNYYEKGSQHIDTQINIGDKVPEMAKPVKKDNMSVVERFDKDTPLSALFRKNRHEELRKVIESWRPYLIGDDPKVDTLAMNRFEFNKNRIYSNRVYYDLLDLDALGALQVSLSQLACYLADHSNLSSSHATLYRQLKKYRQERS